MKNKLVNKFEKRLEQIRYLYFIYIYIYVHVLERVDFFLNNRILSKRKGMRDMFYGV